MPSYTRMKRIFLQGLLWLFLLQYGLMALSLEPGFLDFDNLPDTNFTCIGKVIGGYYADLETNCQMFHVCTIGQAEEPMDIRFLCLNGTVFDQETRVCERIDEVDCSKSEQFYSLNLELYGNSGPILEETPEVPQETEPPSIVIKSTTSTTTTTTTTKRPTTKPASPQYYTTIRPLTATTPVNKPQAIAGHHFPVNTPDIRFNPEEINISLNPGAPPDIRTKHFQPYHSFSDSSKLLTDNDEEQSVRVQNPERDRPNLSTSPTSIYAIDTSDSDKLSHNSDDNFGFSDDEFHGTELPRQQQFLIQTNSFRHSQSFPPNVNHNSNQYHHPQFHSTTVKQPTNFHQNPSHTTVRTLYLHSLKPPAIHQHHHYTHHPRTEKTPQRVQIPIPLLPTLPPLTFSSPAPFTLQRHIETKRYTKDHQAPPRIIISASASVSDASGRRLNYSLGTIGAAQILESPPSSYDEYKDTDVGLDPFYHDVPRIKQQRRRRRSVKEPQINPFDVIKDEKEAVQVLKFLFTWYQSHQATATVPSVTSPVSPDLIRKINDELAPAIIEDSTLKTDSSEIHFTNVKEPSSTESLKHEYENSELFKKNSRFSIVGGYKNGNDKPDNKQEPFGSDNKENIPHLTKNFSHIAPEVPGEFDIALDEQKAENNTANAFTETERDFNVPNKADITELKEKMDNAFDTILKDTKEFSFNPDDYVDDNYEGVVYKENITNTENNDVKLLSIADSQKLNASTSHEDAKEDKHFVDPAAVLELYKYFNVNNRLTTSPPTVSSINENKEHLKLNNITKDSVEDKPVLINNTPDHLKEPGRYTEINIISEVHEDEEVIKRSSTTSTTTIAPSRHTVRQRGRSRQRHVDSNQEASYNSHLSKASLNSNQESRNYISPEQNNHWASTGRRGRGRGRSRFINPRSSTTQTSTSTSTTTVSIPIEEHTTVQYFDTTLPALTTIPPDAVTINDNKSSSTDYSNNTLEHTKLINISTTLQNVSEVEPEDKEIKKLKGLSAANLFEAKHRENTQNKTIEDNEISSITDAIPISIENATEPAIADGNAETESNPESPSELNPLLSTNEDASYLIKLLKYYVESSISPIDKHTTTEFPEASYIPLTESQVTSTPYSGINSEKDYSISTELRGRQRHASRVSSTTNLPTLRDIYDKPLNGTKDNAKDSHVNSSTHTYSNVNIPDENLEEVKRTKSAIDLLAKLSFIEQNLADNLSKPMTTDSPIADTTVTTPLVLFTNHESFGTFPSITEPTKFTEYSTKMFEVATGTSPFVTSEMHKNYNSVNDDIFVVPELTEKTSSYQEHTTVKLGDNGNHSEVHETTKKDVSDIDSTVIDTSEFKSSMSSVVIEDTTEPMKRADEEYDHELTTIIPDVEIQKSISLPISVLDTGFDVPYDVNSAHNINGLVSTLNTETTEGKYSTIFDIPSTPSPVSFVDADNNATEFLDTTVATEISTKEHSSLKYVEDHLKHIQDVTIPEVQQNATEIIFLKNTHPTETLTTSLVVETPGMVNSSHLLQVVVETTANEPDITTTTTSAPSHTRKTRPPRRKPYNNQKNQFGRHRFSTELFTHRTPKKEDTQIAKENITDAPLHRSAFPTRSELKKVLLHTTPLSSKSYRPPAKVSKHYVFNCFGKETNRFYVDPRDCRLFHYCTQGYSKNQLLDLKYVCDQKTFFDEDKLTCTKVKPARCL